MLFRRGLTAKFLLYFILIAILPLLVVSYMAYRNGRDAIVANTFETLSGALVLKESEIDRWLSDTIVGFEDIAKDTRIAGYAKEAMAHASPDLQRELSHDEAHEKISALLNEVDTITSLNFFEFFILSPTGEVHVTTDPLQEGKFKEDRLYFREGLTKTTLQPFYFSVTFTRPALTVSTPLKDSQGKVVGVLAGRMRLERISRIMEERTGLGETGETYLINSSHFLMTTARYGYPFTQGMFTVGTTDCVKKKQTAVALYRNYKGTDVIGAYQWIPKYRVCMMGEISQGEALGTVQAFRNITIFFGIIALVMVSLIGVIVARSIIRPIRALQAGTHEIESGNLDYLFDLHTQDELQELADDLNNMRKSLKSARDREKALSDLKSEFVRIAAHQLRTPLSGLKWAMDILLSGDAGSLTEEQKQILMQSHKVNEDAIRLVGDFLNLAQIEEGKFGYRDEEVDIEKLTGEVVEKKNIFARKKFIALELTHQGGVLPHLFIDKAKTALMIGNIIDNAIQYTHARGSVTVELSGDDEYVYIKVKDTGIGIASDQLPYLFTRFYRGEKARTMDTHGSGLGLYIAKNIVEHYHGTINAVSVEGKGSTFTIALPIQHYS